MLRSPEPNFVAIDFETADHGPDSACAVGLVRVEKGKIVSRNHYYVRPPRSEFFFTHIHGIRWKDVENQPDFGSLWPRIKEELIGIEFLAAHNASFDSKVLSACCQAAEVEPLSLPFLCTVRLARQAWNLYPTKLPNVCQYLGIRLNHHEALSDAEACAKIVLAAWKQDQLPSSCRTKTSKSAVGDWQA